MKWVKERDLLIAQTMAFVQSVTGKRPDFTASPIAREAAPIENLPPLPTPATASAEAPVIDLTAPTDLTPKDLAPKDLAPKDLTQTELPPTAILAPIRALPQNDVRKEIQSRVAAFQAHQHRFQREREDYFKAVLSKVRSAIENGPETPAT
jgi:hypothetical protein